MKRKVISLAILAALLLGAALAFIATPRPVWADEVTFYPTEDAWYREDVSDYNGPTSLSICDWFQTDDEHRMRSVLKLEDPDGGNFTQVLLKLYYVDDFNLDSGTQTIRLYRLTDSFEEYEVTWTNSENGDAWTTPGGDFTTANYASTTIPSSYGWVTFNITNMATDAWITANQDLYVLLKFRYETKDPDTFHWAWFTPAEGGTNRPQVIVTYTDIEQTPTVQHSVDEYTNTYADLEITPTLYDYTWGVLYAQASLAGTGNYTLESSGLNITTPTPVIRTVTALNYSTAYSVRAKMVYSNGTVYSNATNITTPNYTVPTWTTNVDNIMVHSAQLYAGWSNNSNTKTVYAQVAYRVNGEGPWSFTTQSSSSLATNEFNWELTQLLPSQLYHYKGVFTIDGYEYNSDVANFTTLQSPSVTLVVNSTDLSQVKINGQYSCNGADELDLHVQYRPRYDYADFLYTDTRNALTGTGTEYFTINDLLPQVEYDFELVAEYADGSTSDASFIWTVGVDTYPTLSALSAAFTLPNTLTLSINVILNDVEGMDAVIRFWLKCSPEIPGDAYFATQDLVIYADGTHSIDLNVGDDIDWDWSYLYYAEIDYEFGTNQTTTKTFSTPPFQEWVETLNVQVLTATTARLTGWLQCEFPTQGALAQFVYWQTGTYPQGAIHTGLLTVYSGQFSVEISGLVYGRNYTCRAIANINSPNGNEITWVQGAGVPPVLPNLTGFWTWLTTTTGGHWLIILVAMGFTALIFFRKHRTVAVFLCLMIFGLGIVIGWIDPWIIVLLGLGGGWWLFKKIKGSPSEA